MDIHSTVLLNSGREMPILGLGTWMLTQHTADTIDLALELGYPMIDTSGDYGTQPGIAEGIMQSGKPRSSYYIQTKVEEDEDAYEAARRNVEELELEYADMIVIHRPPPSGFGESLWRGLIRARADGLTKDIGVSNYSEERIQALIDATGEVPAVNQIEWSPFGWSQAMLEFAKSKGIVLQAYSPLTRHTRLQNEVLVDIAEAYGKTPAQIVLRWMLQKGVVPLPKANSPEHLRENLDLFDFELDASEMERLDNLNEEYSALGPKPIYER